MVERTSPPPHYLTPTREEMRAAAENVGLKRYSPSLLADLANLRAGGTVNLPSHWRPEVEAQCAAKIRPERDGSYRLPDGDTTKSFGEATAAVAQKAVKYHSAVCDFLSQVSFDGVPGATPLGQATQLLKLLSAKQGGQPGGDGDTLPIFEEEAGDSVARELASVLDEVESLDKEERELLDPEEEEQEEGEDSSPQAGSESGGSLQKMKIAEDFLGDRGKQEMLRVSRQLDQLSRMKVMRENKFTPDPQGDDVRNRPIRNLGEISKVAKPAWATYQKSRTLFWLQASTGQLPVRERGIRVERKQLLYMIIDCSGSMKDGMRVPKACGVLMNRLKAVMKGDAVLYFRFFDEELHAEHFVSTPEEAKQAMQMVRNGNFSGGGTEIDGCSRAAIERIDEIMRSGQTHRPELVVVSDGGDTVRMRPEDLKGTRLHGFLVECENKTLTDLAVKSGGVGIDKL